MKKGHEPSPGELKNLQLELWLEPARLGLITSMYVLLAHLTAYFRDSKTSRKYVCSSTNSASPTFQQVQDKIGVKQLNFKSAISQERF